MLFGPCRNPSIDLLTGVTGIVKLSQVAVKQSQKRWDEAGDLCLFLPLGQAGCDAYRHVNKNQVGALTGKVV